MTGLSQSAPIELHRHGEAGSAVAALHGGPGAPGSVCALARMLGERYTVFEPWQRRGDGRPLTVDRHVADHAAVLPPQVAVVGWSWGAMLGLSYAAAYPDRVTSLTLIGCGTYDPGSRARYHRRMAERLAALGNGSAERFAELSRQLPTATTDRERDALLTELGRLAEQAQSFDPEPAAESCVVDGAGYLQTLADAIRLQETGREPAAFRAVTCPVLMIHGADDPHPGKSIRDTLRRHLPQLRYVELAACGHTPWRERRAGDRFLAELTDWLDATS